MLYRRLSLSILATSVLLTGCGVAQLTPPIAPMAGLAGAEEFDALARKAIGGSAYAGFKIAPELPKASGKRKAVKLTYLCTDDRGHQAPQSLGMLRMMDNLPQKDVHNVVFRDGAENGDSRLYYIEQADDSQNTVRNPQSVLMPGVGEVQSNNPKVFSQILGWTFDNYPAQRRYLQIYTHGGGLFGIGTDSTQTDLKGKVLPKDQQIHTMGIIQLGESLRQGLKGRQLDMIYFRACLMGNVEALYELRGTTRFALASEDVSYSVDNSNLTMTKMFDDMAAQGAEPAAIAKKMAIQAHAKRPQRKDGSFSGYTTMAAVDISKMDELKSAINVLSRALIAASDEKTAILAAYDAVPTIQGNSEAKDSEQTEMRDLWAFTAELDKRVKDKGVQSAVDQVRSAQRNAMLHEKDMFGSASNGMSIFMPFRKDLAKKDSPLKKILSNGYNKTKFGADSAWDEFLTKVISTGGDN